MFAKNEKAGSQLTIDVCRKREGWEPAHVVAIFLLKTRGLGFL
jgi:hypothetical protein